MTKINPKEYIASIEQYSGVKSIELIASELNIPVNNIIKLDGNENPYGPLPNVLQTLGSLNNIHLYPDMLSTKLIRILAAKKKLKKKNLIIGAGSDELIELLIRAYANPSDIILTISPTFGMYSFLANTYGINFKIIQQKIVKEETFAHYHLDENQFLEAAKDAKIVFIARPNNPDGRVISEEFIKKLISLPILVILDEAYIEFSDFQSLVDLVPQFDNFVVLRTFSKAYSLGGMRVGYGVMPNIMRNILLSIKQPYNVNIAAQEAAIAALSSPLVDQRVIEIKKTRKKFIDDLVILQKQFKNFWIHPSEACFILLTFESAEISKKLFEHFYSRGILLRYYSSSDMVTNIRISIGLEEDMKKVVEELKIFLMGGK